MQHVHTTMETQNNRHSHLGGKLVYSKIYSLICNLTNLASNLTTLQLLATVYVDSLRTFFNYFY